MHGHEEKYILDTTLEVIVPVYIRAYLCLTFDTLLKNAAHIIRVLEGELVRTP